MNTYKAYKLRIYPTDFQRELLEKTFGCTRYIYNNFLAERKNKYEESKTRISVYEQLKKLTDLKRAKEWLREIDSCALQACVYNLDDAFQKFFKGNGYPRFRAKGVHESFRTNNTLNTYKNKKYESIRIDLKKRIITLPKLKEVKFRGFRTTKEIVGKIKSATISKDANKYFVSVLVEVPFIKYSLKPTSIVGLDLGIKDFIVTSNGEKLKNEVKINEKRLKGLQKWLSRCKAGSKNRYKVKLKIQRLYLKIRNARKHMIYKLANKIIKENAIVVIENLDVKSMYQVHKIAKHLKNVPISEFIRILKYKSNWLGKKVIEINKYYPSSQSCNRCGFKNEEVKDLSVRKWICPECGLIHDRDINASINIMFEGLKIYMKESII
ncbi:MAG: transposase [Firmicutes bacterium]|nr:transposase [Bacillota bacterium]